MTFEGSLRQFDRGFDARANKSALGNAATETLTGSLGSFGSGTAEDTGCAEGGNVSGAFERSLNGSSTGSRAGTGDVTALLDLAFDVGAKELRKRGSSGTTNTANDGTG